MLCVIRLCRKSSLRMTKSDKKSCLGVFFKAVLLKLKENRAVFFSISGSIFFLIFLTYIGLKEYGGFAEFSIDEFEVGMISDRDVVSNRDIEYVDEKATEVRRSTKSRSVYAVFDRENKISADVMKDYLEFSSDLSEKKDKAKDFDEFKFDMLEKYPAVISEQDLEKIYLSEDSDSVIAISQELIQKMLDTGIIEFPAGEIAKFNNMEITIAVLTGNKWNYENVPLDSVIFSDGTKIHIKNFLHTIQKSDYFSIVYALLTPFLKPNLIYNSDTTEKRIEEALKQVPPVMRTIHKNQKIVKRGFIVTEEGYAQLKIYHGTGKYIDKRLVFSSSLYILFCTLIGWFLFSKNIYGGRLDCRYKIFIVISFDIIYVMVLLLSKMQFFSNPFDLVMFMPAALFTILTAALIDQKTAVFTSFLLSFAALGASNFNIPLFLFTLFSGLSGSALLRITGKRMDLIKTSALLALMYMVIAAALTVIFPGSTEKAATVIFACIITGFVNGILVLGFLPMFESLFNTSTLFRLMELSDLNAPIMQQMLVTVAGTHSHSVLVANLAETACRNIGANPLLARVGAYYHDIGKMGQGEYFIENQTGYNKHSELNPSLSATIIRSHIKLGVEKAKQLRLPQEVIDIISQHHGNSLISYFYNKAKQENPDVNPEDFSYQGEPPYSKEAAVVMLADVAEAACRTLQNPSATRLAKFIESLFNAKIEHGQLDNSDLTFRDIAVIKETFTDILAAYHHSRIEYPGQKKESGLEEKTAEELPVRQEKNSKTSSDTAKTESVTEDTAKPEREKVKKEKKEKTAKKQPSASKKETKKSGGSAKGKT